jgi:hypothetical protein
VAGDAPARLLDEKIVVLSRALREADVPHAFGGALALAYYATPRGTHDIDVNFFVGVDEAAAVLDVLQRLGVDTGGEEALARIRDDGQIRLHWEHTPIDLFFSYDALHDSCMERRRAVPFGDDAEITVLSAEDLVVFKTLFDRPKDWNDITEITYAMGRNLETDYSTQWLERILDPDDARLLRYHELLRGR